MIGPAIEDRTLSMEKENCKSCLPTMPPRTKGGIRFYALPTD